MPHSPSPMPPSAPSLSPTRNKSYLSCMTICVLCLDFRLCHSAPAPCYSCPIPLPDKKQVLFELFDSLCSLFRFEVGKIFEAVPEPFVCCRSDCPSPHSNHQPPPSPYPISPKIQALLKLFDSLCSLFRLKIV